MDFPDNYRSHNNEFVEIYNEYRKLSYKICFEVLKNHEDAEDAVSEVFLTLYGKFSKRIQEINTETRNFICVISKNVSINIYNKRKKSFDTLELDENFENFMSNSFDIEEDYLDKPELSAVGMALSELPEKYSKALYLLAVMQMSPNEIAIAENISEDNAHKRLQRAKRMLKSQINKVAI